MEVLNQFQLSDGSQILLATEEWLTPSGRVIWHKGITPDQTVSLSTDVQPVSPKSEQSMSATDLQNSNDTQLLKALQMLTGG
jgi:carboxyl-terminal processing protease